MVRNIRIPIAMLACLVATLACASLWADDKKDDKAVPAGTWERTEGELKLEFADKDVLKIHPHGDKAMITIVCKVTAEKDGRVKAKVTDHEGKAELKDKIKEAVPVGTEFNFKWEAKDNNASLDDVQGDKADTFKAHLEGKYEKKG